MKQAVSIFLFSLFFVSSTFTQGFYGELEGGPNFPLGLFKNATGFRGGIVHPGMQVGGALGYRIHKTWAIGLRISHIANGLDYPPNALYTKRNPWQNTIFLLTTKISRPITEHLFAELEPQAGLAWMVFPTSISNSWKNIAGTGFVSGIRLGVKYYLDKELAFKVSVNYLGGDINRGNDPPVLSQDLSTALFNMGVVFEWKAKN